MFPVTWNQKHIATNANRRLIEAVLLDAGFRLTRLWTPEQHLFLMEIENDSKGRRRMSKIFAAAQEIDFMKMMRTGHEFGVSVLSDRFFVPHTF